jgi:hypothetical protein
VLERVYLIRANSFFRNQAIRSDHWNTYVLLSKPVSPRNTIVIAATRSLVDGFSLARNPLSSPPPGGLQFESLGSYQAVRSPYFYFAYAEFGETILHTRWWPDRGPPAARHVTMVLIPATYMSLVGSILSRADLIFALAISVRRYLLKTSFLSSSSAGVC